MPKRREELESQLHRLKRQRIEAEGALRKVQRLLAAADARRAEGNERHWNNVLDRLESTLDLMKARVTAFSGRVKRCEEELAALEEAPPVPHPPAGPGEGLSSVEQKILDGAQVGQPGLNFAKRVMEMSLDELGSLTLEDVANMNAGFLGGEVVEKEEGAEAKPASDVEERGESSFEARVRKAREKREALNAARKTETGPSLMQRRKQQLLRRGVQLVTTGHVQDMVLEEIEAVLERRDSVAAQHEQSDSDKRLLKVIDAHVKEIQARASELRRKRAQSYKRRPMG